MIRPAERLMEADEDGAEIRRGRWGGVAGLLGGQAEHRVTVAVAKVEQRLVDAGGGRPWTACILARAEILADRLVRLLRYQVAELPEGNLVAATSDLALCRCVIERQSAAPDTRLASEHQTAGKGEGDIARGR